MKEESYVGLYLPQSVDREKLAGGWDLVGDQIEEREKRGDGGVNPPSYSHC